jgi:RNA polymerase sigma-70 factor (ECF subfamily)
MDGAAPDLRDPRQFDDAYRALAPAAFAAALRVLRDSAAAEEVVQDAFVHLWRRPSAFDPARGSLRSYVTMLARSRALDRWRSRAVREGAAERSRHALEPGADVEESAVEPVLRRERTGRILRALENLPMAQRQALLLAYGGGLTAREIAAVTSVPVGTAKSRLRLGLRRAEEALDRAA